MPMTIFNSQRQGAGFALPPLTKDGEFLNAKLAPILSQGYQAQPGDEVTGYNINRLRRMIEFLEVHVHTMEAVTEDVRGSKTTITQTSSSCSKSGFLGIGGYEKWNQNVTASGGGVSELTRETRAVTSVPDYDRELGLPSATWTGKHYVYLNSDNGEILDPTTLLAPHQTLTQEFADGTEAEYQQRMLTRIARRVVPKVYTPSAGTTNFIFQPKPNTPGGGTSATTEPGGTQISDGDTIDASHINQLRRSVEWLERHTHSYILQYFDSVGINDDFVTVASVWYGQLEQLQGHRPSGDDNRYIVLDTGEGDDNIVVQEGSGGSACGIEAEWVNEPKNSVYKEAIELDIKAGETETIVADMPLTIDTVQVNKFGAIVASGGRSTETRTYARGFWQTYLYATMWISTDKPGALSTNLTLQMAAPGTDGETYTDVDLERGTYLFRAPVGSDDWEGSFENIYWKLPDTVTGVDLRVNKMTFAFTDDRDPAGSPTPDKRNIYISTLGITQDLDFPMARGMEGNHTVGTLRVVHGDTKTPIVTPAVGVPSANWKENGDDQPRQRVLNGTNEPRSIHINELEAAIYWMSTHEHELLFQYEDIAYFLEVTQQVQSGGGCC